MGCVQSRRDGSDIHPNVFQVINIDDRGAHVWSGQLEVTETELILYSGGRDTIFWPLKSLRRYGYDSEIFSFESGRRCPTGQGIYAFKCHRAGELFNSLQRNINLRNIANDSPFSFPDPINFRPPTLPRPQTTDVIRHNNQINEEFPRISANNNPAHSLNGDILETVINSRLESNQNHVPNIYQLHFKQQENNNNHSVSSSNPAIHSYCNDNSRDLADLRVSLKSEAAINTLRDIEDEQHFFGTKVNVFSTQPISPTHSEQYATLNGQDENQHPYMNITPAEPKTPNFGTNDFRPFRRISLSTLTEETNTYANVALGEGIRISSLDNSRLPSESDTVHSLSLLDELIVNYAVLDIDSEKNMSVERGPQIQRGSTQKSLLSPQHSSDGVMVDNSPPTMPLGYTTIDFNKTEALTSVASGADMEVEEHTRRTRHDSTALPLASPS